MFRSFLEPELLDLPRKPTRHLAFGGGVQACSGAHLAQLMGQWLLAQGPRRRLANARALPDYLPFQLLRVLHQLPLLASPVPTPHG